MLSDAAKERRRTQARERYANDPERKAAVKRAAIKSRQSEEGRAYQRAYYQANKDKFNNRTTEQRERYNAERRERYASDPTYREAIKRRARAVPSGAPAEKRRRRFKQEYGITPEQYDAMLAEQDGGCAICDRRIGDGAGRRLYVDHCHDTGIVRGLLCSTCNSGIGQFRNNRDLLARAIEYLTVAADKVVDLVQTEQGARQVREYAERQLFFSVRKPVSRGKSRTD